MNKLQAVIRANGNTRVGLLVGLMITNSLCYRHQPGDTLAAASLSDGPVFFPIVFR